MKSLVLSALLVLAFGAVSFAGDGVRNATERVQDRNQIRKDRQATADARADVDRLSDLIMQWDDLRSSGASDGQLREAQRQIAVALRSDLRETAAQSTAAKREVAQSSREVRSDRRELRSDRQQLADADAAATPGEQAVERHQLRDDRRDKRDDRRDRRDDARDAAAIEAVLTRKRAVATELCALQKQIDSGASDRADLESKQKGLLEEYLTLSRKEVAMGARELAEDTHELREDRRETREDIRQGQ